MRLVKAEVWVVYQRPVRGCPDGIRAVCEQSEWAEMDRAKPGYYTLIQSGIGNEGEAERLARGTSGETRPRNSKRTLRSWPGEARAVLPEPKGPAAG